MLQNKAMLVELTIHQWTAVKHDRVASAEVEATHQAKDAGRYNKRLVDKSHLEAISSIANKLRQYHYSRTLPWTDKGPRLLPSELFMEYRAEITKFQAEFDRAVRDFVALYPSIVQGARVRLNTLFCADDYPQSSEIIDAFGVSLDIMPVPDAADFRVAISTEDADVIRKQITFAVEERQAKAVKECWMRVHEVLKRIAEQCGKQKARIHDSLIDNARDLVAVLSGLNITNDPALTSMQDEIKNHLLVSPDALRNSASRRKQVADTATDLLGRISWAIPLTSVA
jgi:hypothetical protein